jgi:hypothetical protein
MPDTVIPFLKSMYNRTGEEIWLDLMKNAHAYRVRSRLESYEWEGQFEDIQLSGNFVNLTHFIAGDLIEYIKENFSNDNEKVNMAKELLRFVEDQFVAWKEFAPWSDHKPDGVKWYTPAAMEQYFWYVPIDSSTAAIINDFLCVYDITKDELLLEKACALGDSITRMQDPVSGVIPTHWMKEDCTENLENFWINCHIHTGFIMMKLAKATGEI